MEYKNILIYLYNNIINEKNSSKIIKKKQINK